MSSKILLHKEKEIKIYSLIGVPKDRENPSINSLKTLEIILTQFHQDTPDEIQEVKILSVEDPNIDLIKEAHTLFKQLIQLKIEEGYIAINLYGIKLKKDV